MFNFLFIDPENLQHVLKTIFSDVDENRLSEIKQILRNEGVFKGSHACLLDTNHLREIGQLTEFEITKIEDYIRKSNLICLITHYCINN